MFIILSRANIFNSLIKTRNFIASYSKDLLFYSCLLMMRKINYSLIGDKIKIDTNYYYMTPKVNFSNDTITDLKQKLEFNNLYSGGTGVPLILGVLGPARDNFWCFKSLKSRPCSSCSLNI